MSADQDADIQSLLFQTHDQLKLFVLVFRSSSVSLSGV